MKRWTIESQNISTLSWTKDFLIDWMNAGRQFSCNGEIREIGRYHFAYPFDGAITSEDGVYSVIYQKLGTKGLLLKNGEELRELNRSYYHACDYEYPIAFAKLSDGTNILIHCPNGYCRIDFEEVETGKRLTNHPNRNPSDFFHSRIEVSPNNQSFLSKGWMWQPWDFVEVFNIDECVENPCLLDESKLLPEVNAEICTASFITDDLVLLGSSNDANIFDEECTDKLNNGQIGIWDIKENTISEILTPSFDIGGNLIAIDETYAWELYEYPKIVNIKTGEIVDGVKEIQSGKQISSIIHYLDNLPIITFNRSTKHLAIGKDNKIEILSK